MAISLATTQSSNITGSPFGSNTVTLPGSYTTQAGDCIVVCASCATAITGSGAGGTWVTFTQGNTNLVIGYGCAAGSTTITLTGLSGHFGDVQIGVFQGVGTVSPIGTPVMSGTTSTTLTSASVSYSSGQMVVGAGSEGGSSAWSTSVWSDGGTNHNVHSSTAAIGGTLDYELPLSSSSTTYKITVGGTQALAVVVVTLSPPAAGNTDSMFAVMGP